jgi:hypothetical protein
VVSRDPLQADPFHGMLLTRQVEVDFDPVDRVHHLLGRHMAAHGSRRVTGWRELIEHPLSPLAGPKETSSLLWRWCHLERCAHGGNVFDIVVGAATFQAHHGVQPAQRGDY